MFEKTTEIIRSDIPPEFEESAMNAVKLATDMMISKFILIIASQNQKFGDRLEQMAVEAEAEVKDFDDKQEVECAQREAQAYRVARDEIIVTVKAIDKEITKVKRSITREIKSKSPKK